jgi:hypothetical protein
MLEDPERTPLIRVPSQAQGQVSQNSESSPTHRSPGGVARIAEFVRGDREPSWVQSFSWIIFGSYFNVFLAFVPLSFVAQQRDWDVLYRFGFSFFAIVPLAKVCATSSEGLIISSLAGVADVVPFFIAAPRCCIASDDSADGGYLGWVHEHHIWECDKYYHRSGSITARCVSLVPSKYSSPLKLLCR